MDNAPLRKTLVSIKKNKSAYLMLLPFMLFFTLFTIIPVLMSMPIGFTDFNMVQFPQFVGLSNYSALFLSDKIFMQSVRVTLVSAIFTGPVSYVLCFLIAWLINEMRPKLRTIFTLIFYIPSMSSVYTVWQLIFSGDSHGYINAFLLNTGIITSPVQWLTDARYVLLVTIVVQMYLSLGTGFLALRAGFQNIDRTWYEAGAIEGIKNRWQELIYITIPAMTPQLMFAAVMQIVSAFAAGTVSQNLLGFPSTDYKAHTIMNHAYDYGWIRYEMGYASAICMILFVVMYFLNRLVGRLLRKYMD
ncbi:MAG: sugar ABC transporter permease [Ruminococcus sp.]|nr:sugar ABC transporter permease [Ruminococcus sp.]